MNRKKGYTLIELIVTVSLLVIVLVGGTTIFYRSFRSSGMSDVRSVVTSNLSAVGEMMEKTLRYGKVYRLVGPTGQDVPRSSCLVAGEVGVPGTALVMNDVSGNQVIYVLHNGVVASNEAAISNDRIGVTEMTFRWFCRSGVSDKMNLTLKAVYAGTDEDSGTVFQWDKDINMFNSGIN